MLSSAPRPGTFGGASVDDRPAGSQLGNVQLKDVIGAKGTQDFLGGDFLHDRRLDEGYFGPPSEFWKNDIYDNPPPRSRGGAPTGGMPGAGAGRGGGLIYNQGP